MRTDPVSSNSSVTIFVTVCPAPTVSSMLTGPRNYLTYGEYAKLREKIIVNE